LYFSHVREAIASRTTRNANDVFILMGIAPAREGARRDGGAVVLSVLRKDYSFFLFLEIGSHYVARLASNSQASCFHLPSAGITVVHCHARCRKDI
jgi:hypothetical protein